MLYFFLVNSEGVMTRWAYCEETCSKGTPYVHKELHMFILIMLRANAVSKMRKSKVTEYRDINFRLWSSQQETLKNRRRIRDTNWRISLAGLLKYFFSASNNLIWYFCK